MNFKTLKAGRNVLTAGGLLLFSTTSYAQHLDIIGVNLLRAMTTNLDGSGIRVAQPEADTNPNPPPAMFEVNPANVGRPGTLFSYFSSAGSATTFTNALGTTSGHAVAVGNNFYGIPYGVATNNAHVDNYDAEYFINSVIDVSFPTNINDVVVNQSFAYGSVPVSTQQEADSAYDNYAVRFKTLFISGMGNGNIPVCPPATAYNGMGVGVSDGASTHGPTLDNGRCKPDIIAPGGQTSFSTAFVSGAATILCQAALRGDGGADTNSAFDMRTIKAVLMNGAVKMDDWSNSASGPLDVRYGAGMLNVFNSHIQLASGKRSYTVSGSVSTGNPHPPTGAAGAVSTLSGWDLNTVSSTSGPFGVDGVNHYYFNVTNTAGSGAFVATATLVWNRPQSASSSIHSDINNLNLFLYNAANSNLVMVSTSLVDNVEHVFVPRLAPGRYDLQVWKAGGSGIVSGSETYALAWAFVAPALSVVKSGSNAMLTWPAYPAGFLVETATNLTNPVWSTNNLPALAFVAGTNTVQIPMTNAVRFFRLRQPNF